MRRLVILLAAALAGCSVELEGAACDVPGETAQCPSGQACGIDNRCSSKPKYECDPAGAELAVDVAQSGKLGGSVTVTPTGAVEPPGCRLPTLDAALDAVVTGTTGIKVYGDGVSTFTRSAPLALRAGFTLTGEKPVPANVVLQATSAMATVVDLAPGATLRYVTIESSDQAGGDAITVACGNQSTKATLTNVKVNGANKLRRGLTVTGKCGVDATDLVVTGAKQDGVYVDADASENVTTTITRGEIAGNGWSGVAVWGGKVVVQGDQAANLRVHNNQRHGALLTTDSGAPKNLDVTLKLLSVYANGETGVAVTAVKLPTNAAALALDGLQVYGNLTSTSLSEIGAAKRPIGGIVFVDEPPSLTFTGNVVCGNAGDELGVWTSSALSLSADACGAKSNLLLNPGTGNFIYSTSTTPNVWANNNYWSANPPTTKLVGVAQYNDRFCGPPDLTPTYCN